MTEILINGPQGKLQGYYKHHENAENMGLILHPRNCIENSIDNNVVNALFERYESNSFSSTISYGELPSLHSHSRKDS